ncbi:MAG: hypothetical protein HFH48_06545 [Lachnospiraceae bacterium]|nr:hypothetical protein [Lachnospiraceae bacterium]
MEHLSSEKISSFLLNVDVSVRMKWIVIYKITSTVYLIAYGVFDTNKKE